MKQTIQILLILGVQFLAGNLELAEKNNNIKSAKRLINQDMVCALIGGRGSG